MQRLSQQNLNSIPVRARVAFGLACAERALTALTGIPDVYAFAKNALEASWRWETAQAITARDLYDYIYPLLASELRMPNARQKSALFAIVSAMYYMTWHAAKIEEEVAGSGQRSPLPNDIAEVTEEDIIRCLEYAAQAAADSTREIRWQEDTLSRLLADFRTDVAGSLGPIVPRRYFDGRGDSA